MQIYIYDMQQRFLIWLNHRLNHIIITIRCRDDKHLTLFFMISPLGVKKYLCIMMTVISCHH